VTEQSALLLADDIARLNSEEKKRRDDARPSYPLVNEDGVYIDDLIAQYSAWVSAENKRAGASND